MSAGLSILRGGRLWGGLGGLSRRTWLSTASAVEESMARTRGSCTVPVAYTKFDAKEEGASSRPPVVMLHGLLGSQMIYRGLVKKAEFAPMRDVFTVDLRNHGQSPHTGEMDLHSLARDVSVFLDNEGIEKACLMGQNVGGYVAMMLALTQVERVSELVILDSAPIRYGKSTEKIAHVVEILHDVEIENFRSKKDIDDDLKNRGITEDRLRQFLMTNVVSDDDEPGFYKWKLGIQAIQEALPALLSFPEFPPEVQYEGPTLFILGEQKEVQDSQLTDRFPSAQIQRLKENSNYLPLESPDVLADSMNTFLDRDQ